MMRQWMTMTVSVCVLGQVMISGRDHCVGMCVADEDDGEEDGEDDGKCE